MIILTVFDNTRYPYKPLLTMIKSGDKVDFYNLYAKGTNKTIYDVKSDIKTIGAIINSSSEPIFMNDTKSHIMAFDINNHNLFQIIFDIPSLSVDGYRELFKSMSSAQLQTDRWRSLLSASSFVYVAMEKRDVYLDETKVQPIYALDTFTGRSRCCNFNIQGASEGAAIGTNDPDSVFICCDWMAADIRAAAILSQDDNLYNSFKDSDPHTMLSQKLNIPREECKRMLMRTIYSIDLESPILEIFPKLKKWMEMQFNQLNKDGFLHSPLGRKFKLGVRDHKSVFNAVIQGTVAHAMQSSLTKIYDGQLKPHLLAETHDAIIFSCRKWLVSHAIKEAVKIMIKPLDDFDTFPVRVYVGRQWKKWKLYREYR